MLEILILIALTNRIGKSVEAKGYKSGKYKLITIGLWFGGEIVGALIGFSLAGGDESLNGVIYIIALFGAVVGAIIAFLIASRLKQLAGSPKPAEYAN